MKKASLLSGACACFLIFALLCFPAEMLAAAQSSVSLWLTKVFPSLFPFIAACGILLRIGAAQRMGALLCPFMRPLFHLPGITAFPLFGGLLSGYPMGAKLTAMLYAQNEISAEEAQHILAFSNCPGPLFLIGTIGVGFFGMPAFGYLLWLSVLLGSILTGILLRPQGRTPVFRSALAHSRTSLSEALSASVTDAVQTVLIIGGYLILFGVFSAALQQTGLFSLLSQLLFFLPLSEAGLKGICSGMLEMTTGAYLLSQSPDALRLRLSLIAFLSSFGGLSIIGQSFGVLAAVPVSKKDYLKGKLLHALCSSLCFVALYPFALPYAQKEVPVFFSFTETSLTLSFLWLFPSLFFLSALCYILSRRG